MPRSTPAVSLTVLALAQELLTLERRGAGGLPPAQTRSRRPLGPPSGPGQFPFATQGWMSGQLSVGAPPGSVTECHRTKRGPSPARENRGEWTRLLTVLDYGGPLEDSAL